MKHYKELNERERPCSVDANWFKWLNVSKTFQGRRNKGLTNSVMDFILTILEVRWQDDDEAFFLMMHHDWDFSF